MPAKGLIDEQGALVPFDEIASTYSRERWGNRPLPALLSLSRQRRKYQIFLKKFAEKRKASGKGSNLRLLPSVTELLKPTRILVASRIVDYWEKPDAITKRDLGTMCHSILEENAEAAGANWLAEVPMLFVVPSEWVPAGFDGNRWAIPMTMDMAALDPDGVHATIDDYKFLGQYRHKLACYAKSFEKGGPMEEYSLQTNSYALAYEQAWDASLDYGSFVMELDEHGDPTGSFADIPRRKVNRIILSSTCLGHDRRMEETGIPEYVGQSIPIMPCEEVMAALRARVAAYFSAMPHTSDYVAKEATAEQMVSRMPPCSSEDRWQAPPRIEVWADKGGAEKKPSLVVYPGTEDGPPTIAGGHAVADKYIKDHPDKPYYKKEKDGEPRRCISFCPVSRYCGWFKATQWYEEHLADGSRVQNATPPGEVLS